MTTNPSDVSARLRAQDIDDPDFYERAGIISPTQAADLIDSQSKLLAERDSFIVSIDQWDAFVKSLPQK